MRARLSFEQQKAITRLRGEDLSNRDIAAQLGLDEDLVSQTLKGRRVFGWFGLVALFLFFAAIIATPHFNNEHLEGERVKGLQAIKSRLAGRWEGYWLSRGHKRPLTLIFSPEDDTSWKVTGTANDELCPGNGRYSGSAQVSEAGTRAELVSHHPDCGSLTVTYKMAEDGAGKVQMKGRFLRMPTGDAGDHFIVRKQGP